MHAALHGAQHICNNNFIYITKKII
jgi:hypothetical protein